MDADPSTPGEQIEAFKRRIESLGTTLDELGFTKVEHAVEILFDVDDFTFDDPDERTSMMLPFMAALVATDTNEHVVFLSPTLWYARQALRAINGFMNHMKTDKSRLVVTIPHAFNFIPEVKKADVIFMHGSDWSCFLPEGCRARKIIQLFPDETVPVNPVSMWGGSSCCDE